MLTCSCRGREVLIFVCLIWRTDVVCIAAAGFMPHLVIIQKYASRYHGVLSLAGSEQMGEARGRGAEVVNEGPEAVVWLSGYGIGLGNRRLPVRFPGEFAKGRSYSPSSRDPPPCGRGRHRVGIQTFRWPCLVCVYTTCVSDIAFAVRTKGGAVPNPDRSLYMSKVTIKTLCVLRAGPSLASTSPHSCVSDLYSQGCSSWSAPQP